MRVWIFTVAHNDAELLRWWLRYYSTFAERIVVWVDDCTDDSIPVLLANSKVQLFKWPLGSGLNEDAALAHAHAAYPMAAVNGADWALWVDVDEYVIPPPGARLEDILAEEDKAGTEVIQTVGYNLVGDGLPKFEDSVYQKHLWEILHDGVGAPIYSKPVIFKPTAFVRWTRGKHQLENCRPVVSFKPRLKLLHARYLGADYTRARNAKNYARLGADKGPGWSCAPDYDGWNKEGSPQWSEYAKTKAFNVVEAKLP